MLGISTTCKLCDSDCKKCQGELKSDCTECFEIKYLEKLPGKNYGNCKLCTDPITQGCILPVPLKVDFDPPNEDA